MTKNMIYLECRTFVLFLLFLDINAVGRSQYENVVAAAGDVLSLKCVFSVRNTLGVEWKLNDQRIMIHDVKNIVTANKKGYTSSLKNASIAFLEFQVNDTEEFSNYECVTYSGTGTIKERSWIVQIQIKHHVVTNTSLLTSVGETVHFNCTWDTSSRPFMVEWHTEHSDNITQEAEFSPMEIGKYYLHTANNTAWLEILAVDLDDSGVYSCFLKFGPDEKMILRGYWVLQVQGQPYIYFSKNKTMENETMGTTCCVNFGLLPKNYDIQWLLSGKVVDLSATINESLNENRSICSNLTFVTRRIYNLQSLDCLVRNELNISSSALLVVFYSPVVEMDLMLSSKGYFSFSLTLTRSGTVQCSAEGNPTPVVTLQRKLLDGNWQRLSGDPNNVTNTAFTTVERFTFGNFSNGLYRCAANNGVGSIQVSREIYIDVELNITMLVIIGIAVVTALLFLFELVSCLKATVTRCRSQKATSTSNTSRSIEMDDIDVIGDEENDPSDNESLPSEEPPPYNDFPIMKTFDNVYTEKTTNTDGPTESNEEDYMNYPADDVYANT